jgi:hypothetical protein
VLKKLKKERCAVAKQKEREVMLERKDAYTDGA